VPVHTKQTYSNENLRSVNAIWLSSRIVKSIKVSQEFDLLVKVS